MTSSDAESSPSCGLQQSSQESYSQQNKSERLWKVQKIWKEGFSFVAYYHVTSILSPTLLVCVFTALNSSHTHTYVATIGRSGWHVTGSGRDTPAILSFVLVAELSWVLPWKRMSLVGKRSANLK